MTLEDTSLIAFVFTLLAAELFLSGMNKHVPIQIPSRSARISTQPAAMAFLSFILNVI